MSRGKGHVQSSIEAALAASPHATFTVAELARLVYPSVPIEQHHRYAVYRAINSMKRSRIWQSEWDVLRLGKRHAALYFNRKSKRSIAHHRSGEEYVRVQETIAVVLPVSPVPPGAYSRRCEAEGVLHLRGTQGIRMSAQ
jgi:hypothetical protein